MRYLLSLAVLVVLGGGVLLFAVGGDDGDQATGPTVTETGRGGSADVALVPGAVDKIALPAAPKLSDDAPDVGGQSTNARGEAGRVGTPVPADAPAKTAGLEDDDEIERRRLLARSQEDAGIERRALAPKPATAEQPGQAAADGAGAPAAPVEAVVEDKPTERRQALAGDGEGQDESGPAGAPTATAVTEQPKALASADEGGDENEPATAVAEQPKALASAGEGGDENEPATAVAEQPKALASAGDGGDENELATAATEQSKALASLKAEGGTVTMVRTIESRRVGTASQTVADHILPGVRGIEARAGRRLVATSQPGRTTADGKVESRMVAALAPKAPALRVVSGGAEGVGPTFDIVRITATGNAVIAGRAAPGANVVVLDRGNALGRAKANRRGEWVLVPLKPLPPGATELYVEASSSGGTPRRSEDVIVLSIPERNVSQPARVAPMVVLTPRGGGATRVLQISKRPVALDKGGPGVTLDVVDYDDAGNIVLSGRADANTEVRVYTDNRLVGTARSDEKGDWQLRPDVPIAPGDHELRVDSVSVDGKVRARTVLPFSRADLQGADLRAGKVIVQPGNSLWRIARATYGAGYQYTLIYDANRDQIGDPDLIFPGQVFKVPERN